MSIFAKKSEPKPPAQQQLPPEGDDREDLNLDIDEDKTTASAVVSTPYGIADAMRLMRSLPLDQNLDLVVRVVRVTLSSVNVRIEDIVEDATRRQRAIQDNIAALHEKVANLEDELEARRREIAAQEADFKETSSVKERLLMAEKSANFAASRPPSTSGNSTHTPTLDLPQATTTPPPPPPSRALPKPAPRE